MNGKHLLEQIWTERINQQVDSSVILFAEFKALNGLKNTDLLCEHPLLFRHDLATYGEALAIESSMARMQRQPEISNKALQQIEVAVGPALSLGSFLCQFELAISKFTQSEWVEAVHYFLKAKSLARHDLQISACLLNLILCSENLDISFEQSLQDLKARLVNLPSNILKGIENQIEALELRLRWRTKSLQSRDFEKHLNTDINQSSFFAAYLSQLPYMHFTEAQQSVESFICKPGHLFNKDFRLRTLAYQFSPLDAKTGRLIDHIERVYLWVWKWMQNPSQLSIFQLSQSLRSFPWSELKHIDQLSVDNQSMLLLSVGWLSQFDSSLARLFQDLSKKIKFATQNQTLETEMSWLQSMSEKNGSASLPASLSFLLDEGPVAGHASEETLKNSLVVDLVQSQIHSRDLKIQSKSLSKAVALLTQSESLTVETVYNQCISNIEYDSFLHGHQISNMLYKLNIVCKPHFSFRQKEGRIYSQGDSKNVVIVHSNKRAQILSGSSEWQQTVQNIKKELSLLKENKISARSRKLLKMNQKFQTFNRAQMQSELLLSKTEAQRLISSWLEARHIAKKGFGKKTIYLFLNKRAV